MRFIYLLLTLLPFLFLPAVALEDALIGPDGPAPRRGVTLVDMEKAAAEAEAACKGSLTRLRYRKPQYAGETATTHSACRVLSNGITAYYQVRLDLQASPSQDYPFWRLGFRECHKGFIMAWQETINPGAGAETFPLAGFVFGARFYDKSAKCIHGRLHNAVL